MPKLELRFAIRHALRLEPEHERDPVFHVYVSQHLSRSCGEVPAGPPGRDVAARLSLDVGEFDATLHPLGPCEAHAKLSVEERFWSGYLNVDAFAVVRNKKGESCLNQCGSARAPLAQVALLFASGSALSLGMTIPSYGGVGQRTSGAYDNDKGEIELASDGSAPFAALDGRALRSPPSKAELTEVVHRVDAWKQKVFLQYMYSCVDLFKRIRPTWPSISDHNAYVFACRAGGMPAPAYVCTPLGGTPAAYFERALRIVLARDGRLLESFRADERDARAILGRVLTLAANTMAYAISLPRPSSAFAPRFPFPDDRAARDRASRTCALPCKLPGNEQVGLDSPVGGRRRSFARRPPLPAPPSDLWIVRQIAGQCASPSGPSREPEQYRGGTGRRFRRPWVRLADCPENCRAMRKSGEPVRNRLKSGSRSAGRYVPDEVYLPLVAPPPGRRKDKLGPEPLESWDYARVRLGGDCEDLAFEVLLEAAELQRAARSLPPDSPVARLAAVARRHVFVMVLGGVSSAEINGDYGKLKEMGAHMYAVAVPLRRFLRMWKLGNAASHPALLAALEREAAAAPPPAGSAEAAGKPIVLEGTGRLEPESGDGEAHDRLLRREEAAYEALQAEAERLGLADALRGLRRVYRYRRGERNAFYQTCSIAFANRLAPFGAGDEPAPLAFGICRASAAPGAEAPYTLGVEFADLTGAAPDVALWAEPPFNEHEKECVRDSLKDLHPLVPLVPPADAGASDSELLVRYRVMLAGAPRRPAAPGAPRLVYYAKPGVLDERKAELLARLLRDGRRAASIDVDVEQLTARLHCARLTVTLAPSQ